MASECEFTYQDYSKEISKARFKINAITAANFDATVSLVNALSAAILGCQVENALQSKKVIAQNNFITRAPATDKASQRETKWLMTLEDATLHTLSRHEFPLADSQYVQANTDFMDLSDGVGEALKTAVEAVVLSPAGNAVLLVSVQYVGRSL